MAARHLQKLRAAQIDAPEEPEEVSLSEDEEIVAAKAPFNPFDLLTDEEVPPATLMPWMLLVLPISHLTL